MKVVACDSKEFKRPKFARDPHGAIVRDPTTLGVVVEDNRGFYTQLGVAVRFRDSDSYGEKFRRAFQEASTEYRVTIPRLFASSRFVLDKVFLSNYPRSLSFLHNILRRVEGEIDHLFVNWLVLPHSQIPEVSVGGTGAISSSFTPPQFIARMGNMWSAMAAWHYYRAEQNPEVSFRLDHFQGRTSPAWAELSSRYPDMAVVPWGDETDPFIATADILAYLTDKTLRSSHLQLFPNSVLSIWKGRSFSVRAAYLTASDIDDIAWTDENPIHLDSLIPHPMTYLLVDSAILAEPSPTADELSYRGFLESKGYFNALILGAQVDKTGFKVLQGSEARLVSDGDRLVYMGPDSQRRARAMADAVDVRVESLKELRERLRGRGFVC